MSHAIGLAKFKDGTILWYEYDGTSGIAGPDLYETHNELKLNWRKRASWEKAAPGDDDVEVELYSDYGRGFYWSARASRERMVITKTRMPFDDEGAVMLDRSWAKEVIDGRA